MDRLCNALLAVAVAEKMAPATEVALALVASAVAAEATVAAAGEMVTWAAEAMAAAAGRIQACHRYTTVGIGCERES